MHRLSPEGYTKCGHFDRRGIELSSMGTGLEERLFIVNFITFKFLFHVNIILTQKINKNEKIVSYLVSYQWVQGICESYESFS